MYAKYHTKGIVISGKAEGNDSKRLCIFTEDFGLVYARVQGARTIESKLRLGVQDFSFGEFSLVHGRSGWKVVSARSEKNLFEILRGSPEKINSLFSVKIKMAGNVLNLIKKLTAEESKENNHTESGKCSLFETVFNFFDFLIKAEEDEIALAECLTLMRILHHLGYMRHDPELTVPISSSEIAIKDLETIAPRRSKIVSFINESLKSV